MGLFKLIDEVIATARYHQERYYREVSLRNARAAQDAEKQIVGARTHKSEHDDKLAA